MGVMMSQNFFQPSGKKKWGLILVVLQILKIWKSGKLKNELRIGSQNDVLGLPAGKK